MSVSDYSNGLSSSVQTGSSAVYNGISKVQDLLNGVTSSNPNQGKYVLIPPKGFLGGIGGFVFDYEQDDDIMLDAEITDHYAEDNSAVQDHIALKPYRITMRGFVSELILPAPSQGIFGAMTTLQQKLGTVPAYLGKYTPQGLQKLTNSISKGVSTVQNYANEVGQYLNQAKNAAALLGGATAAPTKQQKAFITLATLRDTRQIFNVLTPWVFLSGMAIESLTMTQPEATESKSDISVTMKQMRFVSASNPAAYAANFQGPAAAAYQPQTNLGSTPGMSANKLNLVGAFP